MYSDNGEGACITCTHPCHSCNSLADDDCITCAESHYLSGTECLPCYAGCKWCSTDSTTCSECYDGHFMATDGTTCSPCESPCATCYTTSTYCITCGYGSDKRITPPLCDCHDIYDDGTSECVTCVHPCKYCSSISSTDCLGCEEEFVYDSDTNICEPC